MPWSKRKPYVYDVDQKMPAGRIRSSLGDFFRAPVRHLKESNEKESQFEKPYREGSYNKMHLDMPWPQFRRGEDNLPGSFFGDLPKLVHTFFFDEGLCSFVGGGELEIGVWQSVSGFMALTPPQSGEGEWIWSVSSTHSAVEVVVLSHGKSPKIKVRAQAEFEGIVLICAECSYSGKLVDSYTMEKAGTGFVSLQLQGYHYAFIDRNTNLPVEGGIQTVYKESSTVVCGCVEFTCGVGCESVTPVNFLAYGVNPETIARSNSITLTVENGLAPYSWGVSGTGFTIAALTGGLSNSLIADATACGVATVTVTDACGNSDTYEVRCTTGSWTVWSAISTSNCKRSGGGTYIGLGTGDPCHAGGEPQYELKQGKYWQAHCVDHCYSSYANCTLPWCVGHDCLTGLSCSDFGGGVTQWNGDVIYCVGNNNCYGTSGYAYKTWTC